VRVFEHLGGVGGAQAAKPPSIRVGTSGGSKLSARLGNFVSVSVSVHDHVYVHDRVDA
jgi:hypothetical protein